VAVWSVITRAGRSWPGPVTASRRMGGGCRTSAILVAFGTCVQARPGLDWKWWWCRAFVAGAAWPGRVGVW